MKRSAGDPLADACTVCDAGPGVLCLTATGLHWERARAAGMSPDEMLCWRPPERAPVEAVVGHLPNGDDLRIALAALEAACDLAEQHGAPAAEVARLREVGRSVAFTDARRRPPGVLENRRNPDDRLHDRANHQGRAFDSGAPGRQR